MAGIKITQAVILAGGEGIRLRPLTLTTPKPMIEIHGKPFLEYLITILKNNGIKEVLILVGYLHEKIRSYFGDGKKFGIKIRYSYADISADTGTRLIKAYPLIDRFFLLLYGDNIWPLNLKELVRFYRQKNKKAVMTVYSNFDKSRKSNVFVDEKGLVRLYDRTRKSDKVNGVDIGFFILDKYALRYPHLSNFSFEDILIPILIGRKQLGGFLTHHKYYSLTNHERLSETAKYLEEKKVIFLDRDGVINRKAKIADYITSWEKFSFLPGAKQALKNLQTLGYKFIVITNQPGVGRGKMTKEKLDQIHNLMQMELKKDGVVIENVYSCLHHWDEECFCRKPKPGLLFQAAAEHHINLLETIMVGDDPRDIMAGKLVGCKTAYINHNKSGDISFPKNWRPDIIAPSLSALVRNL